MSAPICTCIVCANNCPSYYLINLEEVKDFENFMSKMKVLQLDIVIFDCLPKLVCKSCNKMITEYASYVQMVKNGQRLLSSLFSAKLKEESYCKTKQNINPKEQIDSISQVTSTNLKNYVSQSMSIETRPLYSVTNLLDNNQCTTVNFLPEDNAIDISVYKEALESEQTSEEIIIKKISITLNHCKKDDIKVAEIKNSIARVLQKNDFSNKIFVFNFINQESLEISLLPTQDDSFEDKAGIKEESESDDHISDEDDYDLSELNTSDEVVEKFIKLIGNENKTDLNKESTPFETVTVLTDEERNLIKENISFETVTVVTDQERGVEENKESNEEIKLEIEEGLDSACLEADAVTTRDDDSAIEELSWNEYPWTCQHCSQRCDSMADLREHSKALHSRCFGLSCAYCAEPFISFCSFVAHVRDHRPSLRHYCEFCNHHFPSVTDRISHSFSHWSNSYPCERCGEQLPDSDTLVRHRQLYKKCLYPRNCLRRVAKRVVVDKASTWDNYPLACQACHQPLADLASLREHAEQRHNRCFAIKCADCLLFIRDFKSFIVHVMQHRPWIKIPCPHCSEPFKITESPSKHMRRHETDDQKACNKCLKMLTTKSLQRHVERFNVHGHSFELSCDVCNRAFNNKNTLKHHKLIKHSEKTPCFVCDVCGRSFARESSLRSHTPMHQPKIYECEYCHLSFPLEKRLQAHVKTHLSVGEYVCNECGNSLRSKNSLKYHLKSAHGEKKVFSCKQCGKKLASKEGLKRHELFHMGYKPYECNVCLLRFSNWGNCNKHMVRRHGVTLARTKRTAEGRLRVDQAGQVMPLGDGVRERLDRVARVGGERRKETKMAGELLNVTGDSQT